MTNNEAIERLREFCKFKPFCGLYPEECHKEECEIYMAIEALETQERQMIIAGSYLLEQLPPAQPERKSGEWTDDNACFHENVCDPFCDRNGVYMPLKKKGGKDK